MNITGDTGNRLINDGSHNYGSDGFTNSGYQSEIIERHSDNDSGYTELLRGSVPCPTCRGLGNVPKEQESQLIALIPLKDDRLKPRRTKLWVCLAVFVCILIAGLLVFFMFPRSVNLDSIKPYLKPQGAVYINVTEKIVTFIVINSVNVTNDNYFSLKVTNMKMQLVYDTQVISQSSNSSSLDVSMRSKREYFIAMNVSLDKDNQMGYMVDSCRNKIRWAHEMVMLFDFTCNYEYFGHSEQITLQIYQAVSCYSDVKPTTQPPLTKPTTKPTTTVPTTPVSRRL